MLPKLRTLPSRVRPTRYETVEGFAARVRAVNRIQDGHWLSWLKPYAVERGHDPRRTSADLLELVAGVRAGHFARTAELLPVHEDGTACIHCTTGLAGRYGCTRCSPGAEVMEEEHDGPRVCRRHSRWVGPGTTPEGQFQVPVSTIAADRAYRKLRAKGVLDAHRLAELLAIVDHSVEAEPAADLNPAERFEAAVRLAARVFRGPDVQSPASPGQKPAERYAELSAHVSAVMGYDAPVLVDSLWSVLRNAAHGDFSDPHRFRVQPAKEIRDERACLDQMQTCSFPRAKHLHLSQYVSSKLAGTRFDRYTSPKLKNDYVCPLGHPFDSSVFVLRNSKASAGCGYCAGKRILAGFNSLADTHPADAAEWHPSLNGDLKPDQVGAGSADEVAWLCAALGHSSWQPIRQRVRSSGCKVCSNRLVDPDVNSLAARRPDLAKDWHVELNAPLRPDEVLETTERSIWWKCDVDGHDPYEMTGLRRSQGGRCRVCTRTVAHKTTSLAATHPHLVKRWDKTKNGKLTPANVLSGSGLTVWWRCKRDHSFPAIIQTMTRKFSCGECTGTRITETNCLRATHPHLAAEFDYSRNGDWTPDNITAKSSEVLSWVCELGHDWPSPVRSRARGSRCHYCINKKVWVGFNDMATTRPDMAADWAEEANGDLKPSDVVAGTNMKLWWKCDMHGPWEATGQQRALGGGCQECLAERNARIREQVRASTLATASATPR